MTRLAVAGVILALALVPGSAMSQSDSRVGAPPMPTGAMPMPTPPVARPMPPQDLPPVMQHGPVAARDTYRPPHYGYLLPRQWVSAPHFIDNYGQYRLPRPAAGFGWSRYYNDAVLTDRYGRVYDWRGNVDWSRDPRQRRYDGVAGAVIGGLAGGVAGNIIGGDGNRLTGTLIGGGFGALAGQAIDKSSRRSRDRYDPDNRYDGPANPHWYPADADGRYPWIEGPEITTTTVTQGKPVETKTVRYVTEYVTVPARRTKYVKRSKYVRL